MSDEAATDATRTWCRTLIQRTLTWAHTPDNAPFVQTAVHEGRELQMYDGDWPAESPYTLYVDGAPVLDFGAWPTAWIKIRQDGP